MAKHLVSESDTAHSHQGHPQQQQPYVDNTDAQAHSEQPLSPFIAGHPQAGAIDTLTDKLQGAAALGPHPSQIADSTAKEGQGSQNLEGVEPQSTTFSVQNDVAKAASAAADQYGGISAGSAGHSSSPTPSQPQELHHSQSSVSPSFPNPTLPASFDQIDADDTKRPPSCSNASSVDQRSSASLDQALVCSSMLSSSANQAHSVGPPPPPSSTQAEAAHQSGPSSSAQEPCHSRHPSSPSRQSQGAASLESTLTEKHAPLQPCDAGYKYSSSIRLAEAGSQALPSSSGQTQLVRQTSAAEASAGWQHYAHARVDNEGTNAQDDRNAVQAEEEERGLRGWVAEVQHHEHNLSQKVRHRLWAASAKHS